MIDAAHSQPTAHGLRSASRGPGLCARIQLQGGNALKGRSAVPRSLLLCRALCVSLLVAGQPPSAVAATPTLPAQEGTAPALLRRLREASGGQARISYHSQTGMVRFFGPRPTAPRHVRRGRMPAPHQKTQHGPS